MKYLFGILMLGFFAAFSFAEEESFGGVGISILSVPEGVLVVEVISGTPAAASGVEVNDRITEVDRISLAGKTLDQSKNLLRGTPGKPLELSMIRDQEPMSITLTRVGISIKDVDQSRVESWYGDQKVFSKEELELVASQNESKNLALVSVLQNGRSVQADQSVSAQNLTGVFVESPEQEKFKVSSKTVKPSSNLKTFNRKAIAFELFRDGPAQVHVFDLQGDLIASLSKESGLKGVNTVLWNAEKLPSSRYIVKIEQGGAVSGFNVILQ